MNRRGFVLGTLATIATPVRAFADEDKLAAVARARAGVKTIVGPFTQVATIGLLRSQQQSSGTLYLQYPNRIRWELGPPDSVTYWVAPEGLAYRGAHGSGRVAPSSSQQADVDALRSILAGDPVALRARFDVKEIASDTTGPAFECIAKVAGPLKKLTFWLDADLVRPRKATIVYDNRNQTQITFGELKRDQPIDPALLVLP
ncbi:MAG TPA: outer membrane lipoprotein carrier protein LolA [Polyangiaceae bacterium]|jgi:outer membrane lipoprotein-sorting protein